MENHSQAGAPLYQIHTLGHFDVAKDQKSLLMKTSDSKKIWELYKFMLTHREKSFTPESLADQLWISEKYADPRTLLRRQMYRLRQLLEEHKDNGGETTLIFSNGYYRWNPEISILVDADEFERLIAQAEKAKESDPEAAAADLERAIVLYKGDYLPDCIDQHWVFSVRNYYRRLFTRAAALLMAIHTNSEDYDGVIGLCQAAIKVDVYELDFHTALIQALHIKGEQKQAIEHYQYITGFFYREMGIKPTDEMKDLYKRILTAHPSIKNDQESLMNALGQDAPIENAFFCDPEVFKSIFELERRRSERSGNGFSIAVLEIKAMNRYTPAQGQHRMVHLKNHLSESLRKGDSFTQWNEKQFVVLLPGVDTALMEKVLQRVLSTLHGKEDIAIEQITTLTNDLKAQVRS